MPCKRVQQHSVAVVTKEVVSAAVNAEAATVNQVVTAEADQAPVVTNAVAEAVRVARVVVTVQVDKVVVAVQAAIARVDQERDNNKTDLRFEI